MCVLCMQPYQKVMFFILVCFSWTVSKLSPLGCWPLGDWSENSCNETNKRKISCMLFV